MLSRHLAGELVVIMCSPLFTEVQTVAAVQIGPEAGVLPQRFVARQEKRTRRYDRVDWDYGDVCRAVRSL